MAEGNSEFFNGGMEVGVVDGDWENDAHYAFLVGSGYSKDLTDSTVADVVAQELGGDASPVDLSGEATSTTTDVVTIDASAVDFGDPVTISGAKWMVVAMGTASGKDNADELVSICELDTSSTASSVAGAFEVDFHASEGVGQISRAA